jgi:uncharacterized protein (DUF3084 family)
MDEWKPVKLKPLKLETEKEYKMAQGIDSLTEEDRKLVEAGLVTMRKVQNDLRLANEKVTHQEQEIKLLELEIKSLKNEILKANDERDIALGRRDEAERRATTLTALHGMIQKILNETNIEMPAVMTQPQLEPPTAETVGMKAIEKELSNGMGKSN